MGNWTSSPSAPSTPPSAPSTSEPGPIYDDYPKDLLISKLRSLSTIPYDKKKYSYLIHNLSTFIKDVELHNIKLIPMYIELAEALINISNTITIPDTINPISVPSIKKKPFIKPEFKEEDILLKNASQTVPELSLSIFRCTNIKELYEPIIPTAPIPFNSNPITLYEFMDSFRSFEGNKDMFGIDRSIIGHLTDYHKQRFINAFNNIYKNQTSSTPIGRVTYKHKSGDKKDIMNFREFVVMPLLINHFHRILGIRLSNYLIQNKYLNTNIQKGSVLGQNNSLLQQIIKVKSAIKHAKINNKPLAVLFLDIKNAYGSIDRMTIKTILDLYLVDPEFSSYIQNYYDNFECYVQSKDLSTSSTFKWKEGLPQGDPLSGVLFNMVFTHVLNYIDTRYKELYGYEMNAIKLLLLAYVDDLVLLTNSIEPIIFLFSELERVCDLVGLKFGIPKCALMLVNIDHVDTFGPFTVKNNVKYLGANINNDGDTSVCFKEFRRLLYGRLMALDARDKDGDKIRIFTVELLPWINWMLKTMYDISIAKKGSVVSMINTFLIKWDNKKIKMVSFEKDMVELLDDDVVKTIIEHKTDGYYEDLVAFTFKDEGRTEVLHDGLGYTEVMEMNQ